MKVWTKLSSDCVTDTTLGDRRTVARIMATIRIILSLADEVAEINPDLVVRDKNGEIYTVRYEAVNAMLLNEFLKEHRRVKDLETTIASLKSTDAKQEATIANQQEQIEALTAGLQKVSAELEVSEPAPQPIVNNP